MANFALIQNLLEGIINNQLSATRSTQDVWEWYNALQRLMSQNRFGGTATVYYGSIDDTADTTIAAPATLFGMLVDNSNSAEPVIIEVADVADADGGDDLLYGFIHVPSSEIRTVLWHRPYLFSTGLSFISDTGTRAGLEAGTAVTGTNPTGILVYTA